MKIRTRLLLFLLPTFIGSIALISLLFAYHWYQFLLPDLLTPRFYQILSLILLSAFATIILIVILLFIIANKISIPIQKLNNSALAIAAGQYGKTIQIEGPKEVAELANTLNTMGECLEENIDRLKENSVLREKLYGEYESAILLQDLMLQKNIDSCPSEWIAIKSITLFSDNPSGFLLDFPKNENPQIVEIHLAEASSSGFEGMYDLITHYKYAKEQSTLRLNMQTKTLARKGAISPLVWSSEKKMILPESGSYTVAIGDYFFLYNQGMVHFYNGERENFSTLLGKVLNVFAQRGLETSTNMLQKELLFATKRKELEEDLQLLCFQIIRDTNPDK